MAESLQDGGQSGTEKTDLQILLSRAVDAAHLLPEESVSRQFEALCGVYVSQIIAGVAAARED